MYGLLQYCLCLTMKDPALSIALCLSSFPCFSFPFPSLHLCSPLSSPASSSHFHYVSFLLLCLLLIHMICMSALNQTRLDQNKPRLTAQRSKRQLEFSLWHPPATAQSERLPNTAPPGMWGDGGYTARYCSFVPSLPTHTCLIGLDKRAPRCCFYCTVNSTAAHLI